MKLFVWKVITTGIACTISKWRLIGKQCQTAIAITVWQTDPRYPAKQSQDNYSTSNRTLPSPLPRSPPPVTMAVLCRIFIRAGKNLFLNIFLVYFFYMLKIIWYHFWSLLKMFNFFYERRARIIREHWILLQTFSYIDLHAFDTIFYAFVKFS